MLYITPGITASVVVTLQERSNNQVDPTYLWQINSGDTNINYYFTQDDSSNRPWYYNQFTFSVIPGATYGATQGIISAPAGQYYYTVYENAFQYNLDPTLCSNIVETGILNIVATFSVNKTYTANDGKTTKTYQKINKNS